MPLVSILIPNYNHAPFLQQRIESVLNQTFQDFELILMDDCSSDNSRDIIALYKNHPKVSHIILNEVNTGSPFKQWQKGFTYTKGKYIWIAESDDYADNDLLKKLIIVLESSPKIDMAYCDSSTVDKEENIHLDFYKTFRNNTFHTERWSHDYINSGMEELKKGLFFNCTINNMSALVFKKSLLSNLKWDELLPFKYCGDWYFLISLAANSNQVAYISQALNYFRYAGDNFKKGAKSVLNYHKEREWARYYFYDAIKNDINKEEHNMLLQDLGISMQLQINEAIKGVSNKKETYKVFKQLKVINKELYYQQWKAAIKRYWKKN